MHTFKVAVYDVPGGKPRETRGAENSNHESGLAKKEGPRLREFRLCSALQKQVHLFTGLCTHTNAGLN